MGDLLISWRNIWRNPRRSILTAGAIAFASGLLIFMLSFQFGTYEEMINASVKLSTGHLQVMAEGYQENNKMRNTVNDVYGIKEVLRNSELVSAVTNRGEAFAIAEFDGRTKGVHLIGVDSSGERYVSGINERLLEGGFIGCCGRNNTIVGNLLAQRLKLKIGSEITLLGQGRDGSVAAAILTVIGIFETGFEEYDRNVLMMDYDDFNRLFYMERSAHRIVAILKNSEDVDAVKAELEASGLMEGLESYSWDELSPGIRQSIDMDMMSGFVMYIILIIVVSFSILNTFIMSVFERTREFGVLLSLGTKPSRLIKIMLTESMFITLGGIVV
ncbi:MAG: ABC transporter permease [Denitrovibrio sp.]|nr:MAG: ABC transporter permease [Denitrovibrio sp.]